MATSPKSENQAAQDDVQLDDRLNTAAADEPFELSPRGAPQAPDPQQGQFIDDPSHDPESARPTRPRTGGPFGP